MAPDFTKRCTVVFLVGVILTAPGCRVGRTVPVPELPVGGQILLSADEPFTVHQFTVSSPRRVLSTRAHRAVGTLVRVGGDSLHLQRIDFVGAHDLDTEWRPDQPSFVLVPADGPVTPQWYRVNASRTFGFALLVVPLIVALYVGVHMAMF